MRCIILGTGSLARLYAALFAPFHPVLIGRHSLFSYAITGLGPPQHIDVPFRYWDEIVPFSPQCVLLAVKWDAMPAVRRWLSFHAQTAYIISVMNGMGHEEFLIPPLHADQLALGTTTDAATSVPGGVHVAAQGITRIGAIDHPFQSHLQAHIRALHLAWEWVPRPEILRIRWEKLIINSLINPLSVLAQCSNGELLSHPVWQRSPLLFQQAHAAARSAGVDLLDFSLEDVERVAAQTAQNISSMLQDIRRGRPTEIQAITGYIVRQGQRSGVDVSAHVQLLHELS
ncbi:MAG: hypothetical protein OWS74_08650 [Firmicutes bacterium]|nr:hypothetical protein [Bacillota bacterium]